MIYIKFNEIYAYFVCKFSNMNEKQKEWSDNANYLVKKREIYRKCKKFYMISWPLNTGNTSYDSVHQWGRASISEDRFAIVYSRRFWIRSSLEQIVRPSKSYWNPE